ncbi:MAG: tetratricopeptide repeat protein [Pseudanabaenaceae cyanobacterium SKYGB_i_bin29]|nr:tetratricopeptide repeat protein [Pseudanabaenaceae cyanobacterium SKYG29]MDW8420910.1 tetratricopeptide repeat protein [Pseudanabaenaceae cyanobacterium SKYGB_i_bin29]
MSRPVNTSAKFRLPFNLPAAVQMGVHTADPLHPYWKAQMERVICLNLCVRKEAHDFIEGFPEDELDKADGVYTNCLANFCAIVSSAEETVEYMRYPGNSFDRQLQQLQNAPSTVDLSISPAEQAGLDCQHRLQYLAEKLQRLSRENPDVMLQWGNDLYNQGDLDSALQYYQRCLELDPDFLQAKYNMATTLLDLDRPQEAFPIFEEIVKIQPDHADAWNSLGRICARYREWDRAIAFYEKAVSIQPDQATAHWHLGIELLRKGDFMRGWEEYEWRWRTPGFTPLNVPKPRWQGEDISDKTILLYTEQGTEEAIQFIRYAPIVKRLCKRLLVLCPKQLYGLFKLVEGIDELLLAGEILLSSFDTYIPLLSVPQVLKTTLDNIPAAIPYITPVFRPQIDEFMQEHLGKFNVGFAWASNNDLRSCPIIDLLPILAMSGVTFFSLQKGDRARDLQQLPNTVQVIDLEPYLKDYLDLAWAMTKLDLIISVDSSVLHLAGAIGKPAWGMLCFVPDWQWLRLQETSPWYPSMRLFWQQEYKSWAEVVESVQRALLQLQ